MATAKKTGGTKATNGKKATKQKRQTVAEGRPSRSPIVCSNPRIGKPLTRSELSRVKNLSRYYSSSDEIAVKIDRHMDTVREWKTVGGDYYYPEFVEAMEKGRAECRGLIRSKQVELALGGNVTMLIWTGKQLLGQREVKALEVTKTNDELDLILEEASAELFAEGKKKAGK